MTHYPLPTTHYPPYTRYHKVYLLPIAHRINYILANIIIMSKGTSVTDTDFIEKTEFFSRFLSHQFINYPED